MPILLAIGALLGVALSGLALDAFRYSRNAVLTVRTLFYVWIAFLAWRFVARPWWRGRRQATDAAIARYIEEHEPALDAALRSAVGASARDERSSENRSEALQTRLVDDVVTTGATASSAARALKKAGAARVDVLALALAGDTAVIP